MSWEGSPRPTKKRSDVLLVRDCWSFSSADLFMPSKMTVLNTGVLLVAMPLREEGDFLSFGAIYIKYETENCLEIAGFDDASREYR